jgi:hypothetical protein
LAPPGPKSGPQSLPPILRKICQASILGYSKGSRGLSVLPRECGIFTTNTISPSPSLRQCSSRYAVHARRNLPDKELRYLRTVIVTAAVYRGFGRQLLQPYFDQQVIHLTSRITSSWSYRDTSAFVLSSVHFFWYKKLHNTLIANCHFSLSDMLFQFDA